MTNTRLREDHPRFTLGAFLRSLLRKMTFVGAVLCVVIGIVACSHQNDAPAVPAEFVMPNVVGKFWVDAEDDLRKAGWTGVLIKGPDMPADPKDLHRVLTQLPAAGERVKSNVTVTAQFGV